MESSVRKPRGLFLNPSKANCSIHESGRMVYDCLKLSSKYDLDYLEVSDKQRQIPTAYDFYAFNYHHITMGWLDTRSVRKLPGLKLTFVLETLRNDPFVLCPSDVFDVYCALDPTMNVADPRVYAFPRPLETAPKMHPFVEPEIPVIGSFGFATQGKGFELVVEAVNREFERAKIRINIPLGTYTKQEYGEQLIELCRETAKEGVEVLITRDFMDKEELIQWCGQNSLNCFLYNRNQPGLSATTDQAISSGRPLAVSDNETFRHIHPYIKPYPMWSLRDSLSHSETAVRAMQQDWTPERFANRFEKVLEDAHLPAQQRVVFTSRQFVTLTKQSTTFRNLASRVVRKIVPSLELKAVSTSWQNTVSQDEEKNRRA